MLEIKEIRDLKDNLEKEAREYNKKLSALVNELSRYDGVLLTSEHKMTYDNLCLKINDHEAIKIGCCYDASLVKSPGYHSTSWFVTLNKEKLQNHWLCEGFKSKAFYVSQVDEVIMYIRSYLAMLSHLLEKKSLTC